MLDERTVPNGTGPHQLTRGIVQWSDEKLPGWGDVSHLRSRVKGTDASTCHQKVYSIDVGLGPGICVLWQLSRGSDDQTQRALGLPRHPTSSLGLLNSCLHTAPRGVFPTGKLDHISSRFFNDALSPKFSSGIYEIRGMVFYGQLLIS